MAPLSSAQMESGCIPSEKRTCITNVVSQFRNTSQRDIEEFRAVSSTEMLFYCKPQNENADTR